MKYISGSSHAYLHVLKPALNSAAQRRRMKPRHAPHWPKLAITYVGKHPFWVIVPLTCQDPLRKTDDSALQCTASKSPARFSGRALTTKSAALSHGIPKMARTSIKWLRHFPMAFLTQHKAFLIAPDGIQLQHNTISNYPAFAGQGVGVSMHDCRGCNFGML